MSSPRERRDREELKKREKRERERVRTYSPSQKQKKKRSDCLVFKVCVCCACEFSEDVVRRKSNLYFKRETENERGRYFLKAHAKKREKKIENKTTNKKLFLTTEETSREGEPTTKRKRITFRLIFSPFI